MSSPIKNALSPLILLGISQKEISQVLKLSCNLIWKAIMVDQIDETAGSKRLYKKNVIGCFS